MQARHKAQGSFRSNLAILFGVAGAIYLIGAATDLSERVWDTLQAFEAVELDELVVAGFSILVAGLIILLRRVSVLETQVAELETASQQTSKLATLDQDNADYVLKCVGCGKYRINGEQWFSPEEFTIRSKQADVLGGVCPNCRPASND